MNSKMKKLTALLVVAGLLLAGLMFSSGCKKSEPETPADTAADAAAAAIQQKTCPIMGAAIDKNIFVEHQGKKVYFCCAGCEEKFKANPEQYLAKLPQFKK